MKLVQIILTLLLGALVVSCGGTEQDPLAGQPDVIKNGSFTKPKPPDEIEEIEKSKFLFIERLPYITAENGIETEVVVKGVSKYPNSRYKLEWLNPDQFPGATVENIVGDKTTGQDAQIKIKWTPKENITIDTVSARMDFVLKTMDLPRPESIDDTLPVFIYRKNFDTPIVVEVSSIEGSVVEGKTGKFKVTVEDKYAEKFPFDPPELVFFSDYINTNMAKNAAPYLVAPKIPTQDESNPQNWIFEVTVDLRGTEMTPSTVTGRFFVGAVAKNGKKSQPKPGRVKIDSALSNPVTTWTAPIEFKIGAENRFDFLVYDAKGETFVTTDFVNNCKLIVGQPQCSCKEQEGGIAKITSVNVCSVYWKIPVDILIGDQTSTTQAFQFKATGKLPAIGPNAVTNAEFKTIIRMVK